MASVTRYIVKYKHEYVRPAKYSSCTKFICETDDGERHEYLCGSTFKNYQSFVDAMKKRYGENIKVDRSKPYVLYQ